ncbi:MAG: DUF3301 domain-containing protein [Acidobacteria bacterium]|nr:DUF3301 domain-containing protein [Acidobacteriota bacterium]
MESLLAIGVIVGLIWFWSDSLRAREFALRECKTVCERTDRQLLDQTVALASVGLTRDPEGRVCVRRRYRFEFSIDGGDRYPGQITLTAGRVESLWLGGTAT